MGAAMLVAGFILALPALAIVGDALGKGEYVGPTIFFFVSLLSVLAFWGL